LLASVLGFGARFLLSDGFQVHDPAPKPAEVRSQAASGLMKGSLNDLGDLLVTSCSLTSINTVSEEKRHFFRRIFGKNLKSFGFRKNLKSFRNFFGKISGSCGNRN